MVDSKRYDPSIKRFQEHTKSFVSGKTKKGHLTKDRDPDDLTRQKGVLVRVHKKKIYERGWEVKVDKKTIMCTYGDNIIYLPAHTTTDLYYVPKKKTEVELTIDKKTKIFTITKINDPEKQPIAMDEQGIKLQGSGLSALEVSKDAVKAYGAHLTVENDVIAENDVKVNTENRDDVSANEISLVSLYKEVQELKKG